MQVDPTTLAELARQIVAEGGFWNPRMGATIKYICDHYVKIFGAPFIEADFRTLELTGSQADIVARLGPILRVPLPRPPLFTTMDDPTSVVFLLDNTPTDYVAVRGTYYMGERDDDDDDDHDAEIIINTAEDVVPAGSRYDDLAARLNSHPFTATIIILAADGLIYGQGTDELRRHITAELAEVCRRNGYPRA